MIWAAEGGLPDMARDLSTVMAVSPPPPATAKSCQPYPSASIRSLSTLAARASPPEVHQCSTSTSPAAWALVMDTEATRAVARARPVLVKGVLFQRAWFIRAWSKRVLVQSFDLQEGMACLLVLLWLRRGTG
ncbi:hypothetical protein Q427_09895 [Halomonas sp. BC04]|nr:hypothetical protein Q427_09895 [Halomonas sp. BC04]